MIVMAHHLGEDQLSGALAMDEERAQRRMLTAALLMKAKR